jgi:hypothetical protein
MVLAATALHTVRLLDGHRLLPSLLKGAQDGRAPFRLHADHPRETVYEAQLVELLEALPDRGHVRTAAHGNNDRGGRPPVQLLDELERLGLLTFDTEGVIARQIEPVPLAHLFGEPRRVV